MRRDPDLMNRLAAADPLPHAEQLTPEEEREADAMLARLLAAPVEPDAPEPGMRWPRRRPWALAAAGVACCAAVAFAVLTVVNSDGPGPSVVERAVAAVSQDDSVYHVVQLNRATGVSGAVSDPRPLYFESWYSSDGRRHEKAFAATEQGPGRLLDESAGRRRPGRSSGPLLRYDPRDNTLYPSGFKEAPRADRLPMIDPTADPGTSLRQLENRGLLRFGGTTRIGERRAYRLVSGPIRRFRSQEERLEYVVDRETYLPLRGRYSNRTSAGVLRVVSEYLVYERLSLNARSRAQLDLDPHPGAKCALGADELSGKRSLGFPNPCR